MLSRHRARPLLPLLFLLLGVAGERFDRDTITFAPDGSLRQLDYAHKAVEGGTLCLGVACRDGVVSLHMCLNSYLSRWFRPSHLTRPTSSSRTVVIHGANDLLSMAVAAGRPARDQERRATAAEPDGCAAHPACGGPHRRAVGRHARRWPRPRRAGTVSNQVI
jgi:hypothetical protein